LLLNVYGLHNRNRSVLCTSSVPNTEQFGRWTFPDAAVQPGRPAPTTRA